MLEVRPLVVADGVVIGGNMRLLAMKDLGYREVPAIDVTEWTHAERDEFMIKDNLNFGDWDYDLLANEWKINDLTDWGMDLWDTEPEEMKGLTDEDDVPEAPQEPITKLGDVWILGEHRVMCGDSTSKEAVEILMDGKKADMVFTDPPYGMNLDTGYSKMGNKSTSHRKVLGDNEDFTPELITTIFQNFNYCKEIFIWGADYFAEYIENKNKGSWFVWDKRVEEKFDKMFGSAFELCWSKNKHKREIARFNNTLFSGEADARNKMHPTQKPLKMIEWCLTKWGAEKDLIADIYLGSGSTLIAAEKTKRKCYGMELDPKYCDVIVKRWEDFTGKKAHLEENEFEVITPAH
jgi:DNA modification methylase